MMENELGKNTENNVETGIYIKLGFHTTKVLSDFRIRAREREPNTLFHLFMALHCIPSAPRSSRRP